MSTGIILSRSRVKGKKMGAERPMKQRPIEPRLYDLEIEGKSTNDTNSALASRTRTNEKLSLIIIQANKRPRTDSPGLQYHELRTRSLQLRHPPTWA